MFEIADGKIYPLCGRKEWRLLYDTKQPSISLEDWQRFFAGADMTDTWWIPIILHFTNTSTNTSTDARVPDPDPDPDKSCVPSNTDDVDILNKMESVESGVWTNYGILMMVFLWIMMELSYYPEGIYVLIQIIIYFVSIYASYLMTLAV